MEEFEINGCKVWLFNYDFNDVLPEIEENYVDLIFTDPPYPKKYLHLYGEMASHAKYNLKDGGSLMSIIPHYAIPKVIFDISQHLKWRWMMCMWQEKGSHARMAMGIEVLWKPIGWWVKNSWKNGQGFVVDGFESLKKEKKNHEWEQNLNWSDYLLKFSKPGYIVCDPMMGSGTVGITCVRNSRNFIGIEKDRVAYETAKERILNERIPD